MEMKYKVLTHSNVFVDINLLEKGIYTTNIPVLYSVDTTLSSLIKQAKNMKDMTGNNFISDKYIDNLSQCVLVDVELKIK